MLSVWNIKATSFQRCKFTALQSVPRTKRQTTAICRNFCKSSPFIWAHQTFTTRRRNSDSAFCWFPLCQLPVTRPFRSAKSVSFHYGLSTLNSLEWLRQEAPKPNHWRFHKKLLSWSERMFIQLMDIPKLNSHKIVSSTQINFKATWTGKERPLVQAKMPEMRDLD